MNGEVPRYAHEDGDVFVCYDEQGDHLITCGRDGAVRVFAGFDDDDPTCHSIADTVYTVAFKNKRFYAATDSNSLDAYIFKDGPYDGFVTRGTAPITCLCFTDDGADVVIGSSDFSVKMVKLSDHSSKLLLEHEAPVLHVSISTHQLLASSSCDGTITVYSLKEKRIIKKLNCLPKSNDISTSKTSGRFDWSKDGKLLFVPTEKDIKVYNSDTWQIEYTLTNDEPKDNFSIAVVSSCGQYLAVSSRDGFIFIFDVKSKKLVTSDRHKKKLLISALAWNPIRSGELAWADNHGNLGIYKNVLPKELKHRTEISSEAGLSAEDIQLLLDDDDGDFDFIGNKVSRRDDNKENVPAIDDDDDDIADHLSDIIDKMDEGNVTKIGDDDLLSDDHSSVAGSEVADITPKPAAAPIVQCKCDPPTPLQKAFQPSSTPVQFPHRFMVWNDVGIVQQYNTEEENSINIEFHDVSTHHAMHLNNTWGHTIAALSSQALLLASPPTDNTTSLLMCVYFASWDTNKEWSLNMPEEEEIEALCLGQGWAAVATTQRHVRLYTVGGVQKQIISVPGPVVAVAGYDSSLLLAYHKGIGIPGDQFLGFQLMNVKKARILSQGFDLPLSKKSPLSWLGFSFEGTPCIADTSGWVKLMNRKFPGTWTPIINTKSHIKGKSDNYWIIGLSEATLQLRAILCRGSLYPLTLPKPTMALLPLQLPYCDLSTEKGTLEESYWKTDLLSGYLYWQCKQGFEVDLTAQTEAIITQQEALMKQFALACRSGREARALEISEMMANVQTVQLAIKYASRLRLLDLAQRLGEVAQRKSDEEDQPVEDDAPIEEEIEFPTVKVASRSRENSLSISDTEDREKDEIMGGTNSDGEEDDEEFRTPTGPLLAVTNSKECTPKALFNTPNEWKNPFKVDRQKQAPPVPKTGSNVFDKVEFKSAKQAKSKTPILGNKKTTKPAKEKKKTENDSPQKGSEAIVSGFQMWFDSQKDDLSQEFPELSEDDLALSGTKRWRELSQEEKKEWNDKAAKLTSSKPTNKRKHSTEENEGGVVRKKIVLKSAPKTLSSHTSNKLSSFMFGN